MSGRRLSRTQLALNGLVALVTLIRNTNPRLRIDQTMRFFWFGVTPAAVVAVALALKGW